MVDRHPAFLHQFFHLAVAQGIGQVPPHARQDNDLHKVGPLQADHGLSPYPRPESSQREIRRQRRPKGKLATELYFLVLSGYELAGRDPYPRGQRDPTPPSRCPTAVPGAPARTDSPGTRPWELAELQQTGRDTPSLPSEKRPSHVCGSLGGQ